MTATTIRVQMAQRKDTAANWTAANPILLSGEIGYETDTKKFKIGNGSTNWNSLAYLPIPDGSGNLTITGNLEIGSTGSLTFEGSTADGFETTLAVTNPTADRTITLPNQSGTVLVSGNASIVDADISATAEIAVSKLADGTARQLLQTDAAGTGVEWASNIDIPGTLDVTGAATFDAAVNIVGAGTAGVTQAVSFNGSAPVNSLVLTSGGLVGVGTSSPGDLLTVAADNPYMRFTDTNQGGYARIGSINGSIDIDADAGNSGNYPVIQFKVAGSDKVIINSSGNVGIGTTNPGYKLDVAGTVNVVSGLNGRINLGATTNYFYGDSSGNLIAGNSGGDRAQIDSSGRLLVGTSSASGTNTLFESSSTTANAANVALVKRNSGTADQAGQQLHFYNFGPAGTARAADTEVGSMRFYGSQPTSGAAQEMARITCAADLLQTGTNTSGRLVFSTTADGASSPTERVRIKSDGVTSFGQGATGPGSGVAGTLINAGDGGILITNNTAPFLRCYTLNGIVPDALQIAANGNVTNANNSYGAISDIKLKENIVNASSQWDDLKALQVRNYNLKKGQTHTQIGLVAQEVELVSPGLVSESPDRDAEGNDLGTVTKSVNYSVLYMKAIKALQEAMERIETLEQRLDDAGIN